MAEIHRYFDSHLWLRFTAILVLICLTRVLLTVILYTFSDKMQYVSHAKRKFFQLSYFTQKRFDIFLNKIYSVKYSRSKIRGHRYYDIFFRVYIVFYTKIEHLPTRIDALLSMLLILYIQFNISHRIWCFYGIV